MNYSPRLIIEFDRSCLSTNGSKRTAGTELFRCQRQPNRHPSTEKTSRHKTYNLGDTYLHNLLLTSIKSKPRSNLFLLIGRWRIGNELAKCFKVHIHMVFEVQKKEWRVFNSPRLLLTHPRISALRIDG